MIVFFKALEVRPNGAPSVPVVSAFLHNLRVSPGDIYDVSQMLATPRLRRHQALGQAEASRVERRDQPAACHFAP